LTAFQISRPAFVDGYFQIVMFDVAQKNGFPVSVIFVEMLKLPTFD
jgi:hypothetical protein